MIWRPLAEDWIGRATTSDKAGQSQDVLDAMVNTFLMRAGMERERS